MDPSSSATDRPALALASGMFAYLVWGVVGYYFRLITVDFGVEPFTLLANRIIWSLVFVVIVLAARRQLRDMREALATRRLMGALAISSVLIATNWIIFIYAAATGRLLQASLGYFLTPLASVLLGVLILRERLRVGQLAAILIAGVGVVPIIYLKHGSMWIPAGLMCSFSLYGLMRKRIAVGPIVGLGVEATILLPLALAYVAMNPLARPPAIAAPAYALLMAAGVITAIPLMAFAYAARRLRLITIGLLQYTGPTLQFITACTFAGESVSRIELGGFVIIWLGLILFSIDSVIGYRHHERAAVAALGEPCADPSAAAVAAPLQSRA